MIVIAPAVLEQARRWFERCGEEGCGATAMIAARGIDGDQLVIPDQRATPATQCSVTVTDLGQRQLVEALDLDHIYVARIHSHSGLAYHSPADDTNAALTFPGAISIVVPFFGLGLRRGLDSCAVHILLEPGHWIQVPPGRGRDRVVTAR
jgi:hypothetical protein